MDIFGDKWIAGSGVCWFDDNLTPTDKGDDQWVTFTSDAGLANTAVYEIAADAAGGIWMATDAGLSYLYYDR